MSIDGVASHKLLYRRSDSVCATTVFSSLEKHHLLASVDPHNPLDETDGATNFLSFVVSLLALV